MIKIAYVHHCAGSGGASNSLFQLLNALDQKVFELHVITPKGPVVDLFRQVTPHLQVLSGAPPPSFFSAEGIDFLTPRMLLGCAQNWGVNEEVVNIIKSIHPDLVHLNDSGLVFLAKKIKQNGYPVILHARCAPNKHTSLINSTVVKLINQYVDKLLCISGSVAMGFSQVKGSKKHLIYNPFKRADPSVDLPKKSRNPTEPFNCLFLANFLPYKGIFETIEAAISLREYSDIHFYIAGSNVRSKKFFASRLGWLVNRLGLYPNVEEQIREKIELYELENVHLLGFVPDIHPLFTKMHLHLAPMRLNAPPRSIFEAGVYQIPSILALQDKVEDMVIDGVNGLIIPERDVEALVKGILHFYNDEDRRITMGKNAKHHFSKLNNPTSIAKEVSKIYNEVLHLPLESI